MYTWITELSQTSILNSKYLIFNVSHTTTTTLSYHIINNVMPDILVCTVIAAHVCTKCYNKVT